MVALPFLYDPNTLLQGEAFSDLWLTGLRKVITGLTACLTAENGSCLEFIPLSLSSDSNFFLACTRSVPQRSCLCHLFPPLTLQASAPHHNLFVCQELLDKQTFELRATGDDETVDLSLFFFLNYLLLKRIPGFTLLESSWKAVRRSYTTQLLLL